MVQCGSKDVSRRLLELGAGFNPEFTGIENVFMNAALMGLSKSETESLLPEIASFAEIGDFIYQPLKTYSSGMYIRLAFAAAIAVAPQILIIDEALAVGDAVFQHRCTRRIKEMQEKWDHDSLRFTRSGRNSCALQSRDTSEWRSHGG